MTVAWNGRRYGRSLAEAPEMLARRTITRIVIEQEIRTHYQARGGYLSASCRAFLHQCLQWHGGHVDRVQSRWLADVTDAVPQLCFHNAQRIALAAPKRYTYVEGWGASTSPNGPTEEIPTEHAWLLDAQGHVLDVTWLARGAFGDREFTHGYLAGVPIPHSVIERAWEEGWADNRLLWPYIAGWPEPRKDASDAPESLPMIPVYEMPREKPSDARPALIDVTSRRREEPLRVPITWRTFPDLAGADPKPPPVTTPTTLRERTTDPAPRLGGTQREEPISLVARHWPGVYEFEYELPPLPPIAWAQVAIVSDDQRVSERWSNVRTAYGELAARMLEHTESVEQDASAAGDARDLTARTHTPTHGHKAQDAQERTGES